MELPIDVPVTIATLRAHGVRFALVFGSHATGRPRPGSDVDLAVWAPQGVDTWALTADLPDAVDLVDLSTAPDGLAGRIAMTGVVLVDDDPAARVHWQASTRKRYLDGLRGFVRSMTAPVAGGGGAMSRRLTAWQPAAVRRPAALHHAHVRSS